MIMHLVHCEAYGLQQSAHAPPSKRGLGIRQTDAARNHYASWRLDIRDTRITWMGSLPHSRESQIDAWNEDGMTYGLRLNALVKMRTHISH